MAVVECIHPLLMTLVAALSFLSAALMAELLSLLCIPKVPG